ncbi:prolyl oligopeptidase family serine peptidase [Brachybacterium sp. NBEC-018]|uniref:prolyl oligopeptidase family serine peptidase n=1 Tax=Brachybacterium sp. NBEC-018 TaxID=2996004 RepID=UPI0021754CA1|nr:prolyl oligopeptidase family serine peptidase [Brachybacterium sp. NBEC-018]UVY85076.1 prolyl oligopeptidase family serine peptidase [Brachybacterium sp. NBEC-018]
MRRPRRENPAAHDYASLDALIGVDHVPEGDLTIHHRGLPIDVRVESRGFDATTIFFHAALTSSKVPYPTFAGVALSEDLPTNRIHISDPSLHLDSALAVAWFAGNRHQPDLQDTIIAILRRLLPDGQRPVFFGASGGGFAALRYAAEFAGSTAIPVNPQTDITRYTPAHVERYARKAWALSSADELDSLPAVTDVSTIYRAPVPNRVLYLQNTGDTSHVDDHMTPFVDALHPANDATLLQLDAGSGHVPPHKSVMKEVLFRAITDQPPPGAEDLAALQLSS